MRAPSTYPGRDMSSSRRHALNRRPSLRRFASALLLTAYVVTAAGIPLPAGSRTQKLNEVFLCATSSCGCQTAEQCWRSCCCHTLAERLAWAQKHGVRPPDFAITQAKAAGFDVSWLDKRGETRLANHSSNCCDRGKGSAARSCCEGPREVSPIKIVHSCCSQPHEPRPENTRQSTVVGWQALKCGGLSMNWLAAVPTLISVRVDIVQQISPFAWLGPATSDRAFGTADLPSVPPPERA